MTDFSPANRDAGRPPMILIAESNLQWRSSIIRSLDYKFPDAILREATLPRQMVTLLNENPDLAILDADLPGARMDVFLEKMATEPALAHIPRLVLHHPPGQNPHLGAILRHATQALARPFSIDDLLARVEFLLRQARGARPFKIMPRSAMRRSVHEVAHILAPIAVLDGRDVLTPAPDHLIAFEELDCDFRDLFQALQIPAAAGATVRCRLQPSKRVADMMTLRPVNLSQAQARALDGVTEKKGLMRTEEFLPRQPRLGLPVRLVDMSFSGIQLESVVALAPERRFTLSLQRFLPHLFTPCKQSQVTCRCVRVEPSPHHFTMGLRMEDAGPDLTAAILHWAASGA